MANEPFTEDRLSDPELHALLRAWTSPDPPNHLRTAIFGEERPLPWWSLWTQSIRVPVPAVALLVLFIGMALWKWPARIVVRDSPPRLEVRTVRVEVPVLKKEVLTRVVYRDRPAPTPNEGNELRPVTELKPRIIRSLE
jgi:hypothetical protein